MLTLMQRAGQAGFEGIRRVAALGFSERSSPLQYLGALTIFFFWIVLVSGIWLLLFFKTSVGGAYDSVQYLTHDQWYLGGVMRSLHRYASDAAVITLGLHIVKELSFDRYRGKRWFSWVTGVPLLWLVFPLGITGYWLVWDELAQYVALSSAELLDRLPIFTGAMASNFLSDASLSDRFFTLMAFLHLIGLPLILVFGIWLHVFRIASARINPPRTLMAGALLAMLVLSAVYPAVSHGPANLARMPDSLGLDWFYLAVYPLIQMWSPGAVWWLLLGVSALIVVAPWLPPARREPEAVVDLDNCNGCERCVVDCPYSAVSLVPRTDGKAYEAQAEVDPDLCVSCGICVGSCPTATPFRTRSDLVPGIDLPGASAASLREALAGQAPAAPGSGHVLIFGCEGTATTRRLARSGERVVELKCMAHLPPPFIDYVLSKGLADGVFLAGCAGGDCQYRFGADWTEQRIGRSRDPQLRKRVDTRRVAMAWRPPWSDSPNPGRALAAFRDSLATSDDPAPAPPGAGAFVRKAAVLTLAGILLCAPVAWLSSSPRYQLMAPGEAMLSLSFSHAGQRLEECRTLTQEELNKLPPNMRTVSDCPRERRPIDVTLRVDGEVLYAASLPPSGIWNDGESSVYQRFRVNTGTREVFVGMNDSNRETGYDYQGEQRITLTPGQHLLVQFDGQQKTFVFR